MRACAIVARVLTDAGVRQTTLPPGQAHSVEVTVGGHKIVFESEKYAPRHALLLRFGRGAAR